MIQGGQVVDMSGILGSATSDFTRSLVQRMTYKGKLYAVPQVTDMQLLVYRKSLLQAAGVNPPTTVDELIAAAKTLTTDRVKGFFAGNDGGIGALGGPMLWSAGQDYLNEDQTEMGFDAHRGAEALGRLRTLFTSNALLLGASDRLVRSVGVHSGARCDAVDGVVDAPGDREGLARRLRRDGVAGAGRPGQALGAGTRIRILRQCPEPQRRRREGVREVALGRPDREAAGLRAVVRISHPGAAERCGAGRQAEEPARLGCGQAGQRVRPRQSPLLWTPKCATAFSDGLTRIVKDGADAKGEIETIKATVDAELERVNG